MCRKFITLMFNSQTLFEFIYIIFDMTKIMKTQIDDNETDASLRKVLKHLVLSNQLSANMLAKTLNLPTPTIQRLLTGEVLDPRASTLMAIADYFCISIDQLLGREKLSSKYENQDKLAVRLPNTIPIFTLAELNDKNMTKPASWLKWQHQSNPNDQIEFNSLFAVAIKNDLYEPIFHTGTFLIINPEIDPRSGDYVLIKFMNDNAPVIKKYVAEGDCKYLYSLKSDVKTVAFEPNKCKILGIISESYINFRFMEN